MATDLKTITTVEDADQAISETEEAIEKGEKAIFDGAPWASHDMVERRRQELRELKQHRAKLVAANS